MRARVCVCVCVCVFPCLFKYVIYFVSVNFIFNPFTFSNESCDIWTECVPLKEKMLPIYIYMCACVCVCVLRESFFFNRMLYYETSTMEPELEHGSWHFTS